MMSVVPERAWGGAWGLTQRPETCTAGRDQQNIITQLLFLSVFFSSVSATAMLHFYVLNAFADFSRPPPGSGLRIFKSNIAL